mmetsp:Transcript_42682/g.51918  ORF Transcript_42682/g.51918 Transcript_42682/m.51918 type:complete len:123 (+) Transcript_42682:145-513(+)|eukprot:CAMPEP_0172494258 /NCGR_PEP_ID=MMETSP1066-20121228/43028_1 /TAXON_ID=671091 /ORGANISM="Coscinodiscus wailesii, Strain CCMP2513" /LENGTH=122 /DNA_ID=CAMNT_0013265093 /DNA_START=127 /DNA_END=495 /DNA_ORIENTATION=+
MDKLTKQQHDEYATAFAIMALYDGGAEVTSESINNLLTATNNTVEAYYPVIFANFLSSPEKIAEVITTPGGGGGGGDGSGAGGDGGAEEEEEEVEEKVEEESIDMGGGGGLFGDDEGGDGDY